MWRYINECIIIIIIISLTHVYVPGWLPNECHMNYDTLHRNMGWIARLLRHEIYKILETICYIGKGGVYSVWVMKREAIYGRLQLGGNLECWLIQALRH